MLNGTLGLFVNSFLGANHIPLLDAGRAKKQGNNVSFLMHANTGGGPQHNGTGISTGMISMARHILVRNSIVQDHI